MSPSRNRKSGGGRNAERRRPPHTPDASGASKSGSHDREATRNSERGPSGTPARGPGRDAARGNRPPKGQTWLYGHHAVAAALNNPERIIHRLIFTGQPIEFNKERRISPTTMQREALDALLPPGAVHQGCAALVETLPFVAIEDICRRAETRQTALVVVLDQVSDPQNIGAVIRSAAVFGALAVIVQDRHAPEVTGAMAKAASGAIEHVPLVRVTNVVRALETLKNSGFWCVGLDSEADTPIERAPDAPRRALVLGAEGPGMRRLTADSCDLTVRIESETQSPGAIISLNVSNAAAVALYALSLARQGG